MAFTLRREGLIECKRTKSTEARQQLNEQSGKIAPSFKNNNGIGKDYHDSEDQNSTSNVLVPVLVLVSALFYPGRVSF